MRPISPQALVIASDPIARTRPAAADRRRRRRSTARVLTVLALAGAILLALATPLVAVGIG